MRQLNEYKTLGKTGLKVSPVSLGTMTFGTDWGWGASAQEAKRIFASYVERGGNLIDTADLYTNGKSEEFIGEFIKDLNARDKVAIATKFSFNAEPGNPNAGGNGRKNIRRALEGSLKRLQTDYIDLYILHAYDMVTPVEEVMNTLNDLVREGKILHIGLSNVPAWYAARAQTWAEYQGSEPVSSIQMEYSLVARSVEREHQPMAQELNMGILAWSPLAGGFLSGKYSRQNGEIVGKGRVAETKQSGNPIMEKFDTESNWTVLKTLEDVAKELNRTPAEVAINWVVHQNKVTSTLIAATRLEQLEKNIQALEFDIPKDLLQRLNQASQPEKNDIDHFSDDTLVSMINGGTKVLR